jgi:hypothetical protein
MSRIPRFVMIANTQGIYGIPPERGIGSSKSCVTGGTGTVPSSTRRNRTCSTTVRPSPCGSGAGSGVDRSSPSATRTVTSRCCSSLGGPSRPALRLLVLHDDAAREFDDTAGAEAALRKARAEGWTVIGMKNDWASVFADEQ